MRRAHVIQRELGAGIHSVLFVGDDDATSIALALLEPNWSYWVVDIDERVLDYLRSASVELDVALVAEFGDVRAGPAANLKSRFSGVVIDPPRLYKPCLDFLRFARDCLSQFEPARIFWSDHPDWTLGYAKILAELQQFGLTCVSVYPELHRYVHSSGREGNLEMLDERQQYFEVLEELSRAFQLDPRWLRELAVRTQPWSHLHVLGRASGVAR